MNVFSTHERCIYRKNQLGEVICQLRFPEILSIGANPPVDFQEAIRDEYPVYSARREMAVPKLPGANPQPAQKGTMNYQFASADGKWRVNLTSKFIALACSDYHSWEQFARKLDKPLAAFIQVYKPAYFERVGLRYINFVSRKELSLEGTPYRELFHSRYLGILADEQVNEASATRCSVDVELAIRGGCRAKIHAGPGIVKRGKTTDGEVKFIFDQDLYMPGKLALNLSAGALETLHSQAFSIFRDAITDELHEAMDPEEF